MAITDREDPEWEARRAISQIEALVDHLGPRPIAQICSVADLAGQMLVAIEIAKLRKVVARAFDNIGAR